MRDDLALANSAYWSELCGSRAAHSLGLAVGDPGGVQIFDEWFFGFYPYLATNQFIDWEKMRDQQVLEIGLGYESVTRRLATTGAQVTAVDLAPGAVAFAQATGDSISPIRASTLQLPFVDHSLDCVISIGCLHHTGDLAVSLRECFRVVRPGGTLIVMVYNRYSYKRWIVAPIATFKEWVAERQGRLPKSGLSAPRRVSWFWDRSPSGAAPPHTEFASKKQLQSLLSDAKNVDITTINVDDLSGLFGKLFHGNSADLRSRLLNSWLSRRLGLDLYVTVVR